MKPRPEVPVLPYQFDSWEECRDFYALEAMFLGQYWQQNPTRSNKRRYEEAARKAVAANARCKEPLPMET